MGSLPPAPPPPPAPERGHKVQIAVAAIGLAGVLGSALLANWDKVFKREAPLRQPTGPSQSAAPGAVQSPVVSGVQGNVTIQIGQATSPVAVGAAAVAGTWVTSELQNPYAANSRYRLQFEFISQGEAVHGSVTVLVTAPTERRASRPIVEGRVADGMLSFATRSESTSGRMVTERYVGQLSDGAIAFTRVNDENTGGQTERFTARRL